MKIKKFVTYNAFNKVSQIKDTLVNDAYQLNITYGPGSTEHKHLKCKTNNNRITNSDG